MLALQGDLASAQSMMTREDSRARTCKTRKQTKQFAEAIRKKEIWSDLCNQIRYNIPFDSSEVLAHLLNGAIESEEEEEIEEEVTDFKRKRDDLSKSTKKTRSNSGSPRKNGSADSHDSSSSRASKRKYHSLIFNIIEIYYLLCILGDLFLKQKLV